MWLVTPIGFFSIVQKPDDAKQGTLTVRARVGTDLDALRALHLPELGETSESSTHDYRFRAKAPREAVGRAMLKLVQELTYGNFKAQVSQVQGAGRAGLYHDVWDVLYRLQTQPGQYAGQPAVAASPLPKVATPSKPKPPTVALHPRLDEHGKQVTLKAPSQPTPVSHWNDANALARVVPDGPMPTAVNGTPIASWVDAPVGGLGWEALAQENPIPEPAFLAPVGYKKAAGVVVREPDGRWWVVAPSNQFAGYSATFPKGGVEGGCSLQATALMEAYEESGLKVRLVAHLLDVKRSQSYTRYYLAEREGGNPADMGWETQAVMLVPHAQLPKVLTHPYDQALIEALQHA